MSTRRTPPDWPRALRALRRLLAHPDETHLALEIGAALEPEGWNKSFARLSWTPAGRQLLERRPSLVDALTERKRLEELPEGSLGRAYLDHIDRYGLDPTKIVELQHGDPALDGDPALAWYAARSALVHDLAHVVTGYGADEVGESSLLPFSLAQRPGLPNLLLTLGAGFRTLGNVGRAWPGYMWKAWRAGRRATLLDSVPWEDLLAEPLDEVRRRLHLELPEERHPTGVLRSEPSTNAATT